MGEAQLSTIVGVPVVGVPDVHFLWQTGTKRAYDSESGAWSRTPLCVRAAESDTAAGECQASLFAVA